MTIVTTGEAIVVPEKPLCSRCRKRVRIATQFFAVSTEHGVKYPASRGSKRSVRLCLECIDALRDELRRAIRKDRR